jgi:hypothetical protein
MTTYYLRENGNDLNSGYSESAALETWGAAMALAQAGDTINYQGTFGYCCTEYSSPDAPSTVRLVDSGDGTGGLSFSVASGGSSSSGNLISSKIVS